MVRYHHLSCVCDVVLHQSLQAAGEENGLTAL